MKEKKTLKNGDDVAGAHDAFDRQSMPPATEAQPTELLAHNQTGMEQLVYELIFDETRKALTQAGALNRSHLMIQTEIYDHKSLRGLVNKISIKRKKTVSGIQSPFVIHVIYSPLETLALRRKAGFSPYPHDIPVPGAANAASTAVEEIEKLMSEHNLSRRQAQVARECAGGLSNAEISTKLLIRQETVKFHLRNIFIKFGVRRRAELIAYLFRRELTG